MEQEINATKALYVTADIKRLVISLKLHERETINDVMIRIKNHIETYGIVIK